MRAASAHVRASCACEGNAFGERLLNVSSQSHDSNARAVATGDGCLAGLQLRPFCAPKRSSKCNVTIEPADAQPQVVEPANAPHIAWCITGGVRSFFSETTHGSIYRNAIRAIGGRPRVFFDGLLPTTNDFKSGEDLPANSPPFAVPPPSERFDNLSSFLAAHPEWARITADVRESREAVPPLARANPRCALPRKLAYALGMWPASNAQMARWHAVMNAVRRYEAREGLRFASVAKLRFDVAVAAPLPGPSLLRSVLAEDGGRALVAWPVTARVRVRMLPLPDHFWIMPRANAPFVFDLMRRYHSCSPHEANEAATRSTRAPAERGGGMGGAMGGASRPRGVLPPTITMNDLGANETITEAMRESCAQVGLCGGPCLCCGGFATGLLVRAMVNAMGGAERVALLEWPIFVIGRRREHSLCRAGYRQDGNHFTRSGRVQGTSVRGYFASSINCSTLLSASE